MKLKQKYHVHARALIYNVDIPLIKFLSFSRYRGKKFRQIRYDRYVTSKSRQVTGVNYPTGTRRGRGYLPSLGRQYRYPPKSGWVKHFHANGLLRMPLRLDKNRFSNRESSYSRGQRDSPYYSSIRLKLADTNRRCFIWCPI